MTKEKIETLKKLIAIHLLYIIVCYLVNNDCGLLFGCIFFGTSFIVSLYENKIIVKNCNKF